MKGRRRFTSAEAVEIKRLLMERRSADDPKSVRRRLRAMGFHISDWETDLTPSGFDALVLGRAIVIDDDDSGDTRGDDESARVASSPVAAALVALASTLATVEVAERTAPDRPGLYAVYPHPEVGAASVWGALGLGEPLDRPLYVGKAEASLRRRDVATHFSSGRTGSSTLRRTLAALLREELDLTAQPRNPTKPERFANYGLDAMSDERLTAWMRRHLALALWPKPPAVVLKGVETLVIQHWTPPLNVAGVVSPWGAAIRQKRRAMAAQAAASVGLELVDESEPEPD